MAEGRILLQHAERFILSGKSQFLFYNTETKNKYWFRVKEQKDEIFYVYSRTTRSYLGKINFRDFTQAYNFASLSDGDQSSVKVFDYVWKRIINLTLQDTIHVMHLGMCGVCGRPLTDPESIKIGIGPICLSRLKTS